jgi:hypothetical protein
MNCGGKKIMGFIIISVFVGVCLWITFWVSDRSFEGFFDGMLVGAFIALVCMALILLFGFLIPNSCGAYKTDLIEYKTYELIELTEDKYVGLEPNNATYIYSFKDNNQIALSEVELFNTELEFDKTKKPTLIEYENVFKNNFTNWMFGIMNEGWDYKIIVPDETSITYNYKLY